MRLCYCQTLVQVIMDIVFMVFPQTWKSLVNWAFKDWLNTWALCRSLPTIIVVNLRPFVLSPTRMQPLVIHPQRSLPWLPALLPFSFDGVISHALIATVILQDTQYATAEVMAVRRVFLCLELTKVREPTLQHCWYPLPTTPFRWQQLPALEPLDHSVPHSLRQHHLQEVSLWYTLAENMCKWGVW